MAQQRLMVRTWPFPGRRPDSVRVRLLGGFGVSVGTRTVERGDWRLNKAGQLVKLLALARGRALHRERAMDLLWPDLGARPAANNLHRAIHFARAALEGPSSGAAPRHLMLQDGLLALCPDGPLWIDVEAFEDAAANARRSREPGAYRAAVELYAGELLPGDLYEPWTEEKRDELRRLYRGLLIELSKLHQEREEYDPAVEALERAVAEEPAGEDAHAGLMRLYAAAGRRHEALLQYGRLREALSKKLDVRPTDASRRLYDGIRAGESPILPCQAAAPKGTPDNLPASLTSFVGREREMLEVKRALSMTRLLTLAGAGGAGKTRLAVEVARDLAGAYPGGVWLVELALHADPALAPRAVAAALGVLEQPNRPIPDTLSEYLASRRVLLVLDNCEHLVDAAAKLVNGLIRACPGLRVLATSREPLGVAGESVWPVPALSLPDVYGTFAAGELEQAEAVRLFVDRARSRLPTFELTPENAPAVAEVCRKLDGIPLAIELAAARMAALAVEQVAERLDDSLKLLTGGVRTASPRQQTMRATLDWSHDLLSEPERTLFRRLSVFVGGFSLEAAEVVGAGGDIEKRGVLDLLSRLVDKSMVIVEAMDGFGGGVAGETTGLRYGMLEPIRQYGRERLEAAPAGEAGGARRRHANWYFQLAREVEPWLRGAWLEDQERLEREYGNLRAALEWTFESGDVEQGLWFGGALAEFWYVSGRLGEARRWLEAALANGEDAPPTPARTKALARAGWISWEQGDYARSIILSRECLTLARALGDEACEVAALSSLGWATLLGDHLDRAATLSEEAMALARRLGDAGGVARTLLVPGMAAVVRREYGRATALHEESLLLAREAGDGVAAALSLGMGVFAALGGGDRRRAEALCKEALHRAPRPRVMIVTAFHLHASAALAGALKCPARAARLWASAKSLREYIGAALSPVERRTYEPYIAEARAGLGEAAWKEAWAEGEAMTAEEAIRYAATDEEPTTRRLRRTAPEKPPARPLSKAPAVLTRRQREVAVLVARGFTNRRISSEMAISENTVANHVAAILDRLDASARSQIAAWASEERLRVTE